MMNFQLIEVYVPNKHFEKVDESLRKFNHTSYWEFDHYESNRKFIRILVEVIDTEEILNYLENVSNVIDGFEVLLFPVHTYLTRDTETEKDRHQKAKEKEEMKIQRASRQELLGDMERSSKVTVSYTVLVIISAIVGTIGIIKNSPAVVIGSMVIAPMIGPALSIAFSAILGDYQLFWRSSVTLFFAVVIITSISIAFSMLFTVPLDSPEYVTRTHVNISDIVLALASGVAGALSILKRMGGSLVGVMVAVALLPPNIVFGMSIGSQKWEYAYGAFLLLLVNINSILLSAIIVFSLSGIRPVKWKELQRAHTSKRLSITFVSLIIFLLVIAVLVSNGVDLI
jgi:uncharacterized hydrophobic protein (TIGR00341 family)